jgi:hypothetical protein
MADDANIYSLIMSATEPDAQQKAATLAALLRRQQTAGQLMQMHPLMAKMGASMLQSAGQQQGQLGEAGQTRYGGALQRGLQEDRQAADLDMLGKRQAFEGAQTDKELAARAKEGVLNRALEREKARVAAGLAAAKAALGKKGKDGAQIPASEASQVGQYDAALSTLKGLETERNNKTGAMSGLMQYVPGSSAAQYLDAQKQAAQTIGTILEGGKLTDADLPKYLDMLPSAGDSAERANEKLRRIRESIHNARESKLGGLKAAGFNTEGFAPLPAEAAPAAPAKDSGGDLVMVMPPGGSQPVPVHRSKLQQAITAGGKVIGG